MSWHLDDGNGGRTADDGASPSPWADDEALSADLRDAVAEAAMAERVLTASRTAFAAHRGMIAARGDLELDLELLTLVFDSREQAEPAGVRDRSGGASRTLVFESDDLGVEIEVDGTAIEGQLIPPRAGRVTLRSPEATLATTETDEVGYFRFDVHPNGPLRLECAGDAGTCVTEWLPW